LDLLAHGEGEALTHGPGLLRVALARPGRSERVANGAPADRLGHGQTERWIAPAEELSDVEVVDDLDHQFTQILDERHVPLDVARHAQSTQHVLAEAVRRGDRRRVEIGEGFGQEPALLLDAWSGRQHLEDVVVSGWSNPVERLGQAL